jgi:hypothetical protein
MVTNIIIPRGVKKIESQTFISMPYLQTVAFEPGSLLEIIGEEAFGDCSSLQSICIPASVHTIEDQAFFECQKLSNVTFEENSELITIGDDAFYNCSSLQSIYIPALVQTIGKGAFLRNTSLSIVTFEENSELLTIGPSAFQGCNIQSICIPSSVQTIESQAFYSNTALQTVTFEEGSKLCSIGDSAFSRNSSLTSIVIPSTVEKMGQNIFMRCSNLQNVTFLPGSKLQKIEAYSFLNTQIKSITIPINVTEIEEHAFEDCFDLRTVNFEHNSKSKLEGIDNCAFTNCTSLEEIDIPSGVRSIGNRAFLGCSSLAKVAIPENVQRIEPNIFENCRELKYIGSEAFLGCSSLTNIKIPSNVEVIGSRAFENCTQLSSIVFKEKSNLKIIGDDAFKNCAISGEITIPEKVKIGRRAFAGLCISINLHHSSVPFMNNEEHLFLWLNGIFGLSPSENCRGSKVTITEENGSQTWELIDPSLKKWKITKDGKEKEVDDSTFQPPTNEEGKAIFHYVNGIQQVIKKDAIIYLDNLTYAEIIDENFWRKAFCCDKPHHVTVVIGENQRIIANSVFSDPPSQPGFFYMKDFPKRIYPHAICFTVNSKVLAAVLSRCSSIQKINIPKGIQVLDRHQFTNCINLKEVNFEAESELKTIMECSFLNCTSLEKILIPPQVEEIKFNAFKGCSHLTSVTFLGKNIKKIDKNAFAECPSLKDIVINCRDFSHFVNGGFCNVVLPSVKTIEINLDNWPNEEDFLPFLTQYCGNVRECTATFKDSSGGVAVFKCNDQGKWE